MTDTCVSGSFAFRCLRREADLMVEPLSIVALIHHCCRKTLAMEPVGFEWALTCSRPRLDDFGSGWCAVLADRIDHENTGSGLSRALAPRPSDVCGSVPIAPG